MTVTQLPSMFSLYPHAEVTHAHSQLGIFLLSLLVIWEPSHMAIGKSWCMGGGGAGAGVRSDIEIWVTCSCSLLGGVSVTRSVVSDSS